MAQPKRVEESVAKHYDKTAFEQELVRLPNHCPVELAVTLRWLARITRAGDMVAEIGVGGGTLHGVPGAPRVQPAPCRYFFPPAGRGGGEIAQQRS